MGLRAPGGVTVPLNKPWERLILKPLHPGGGLGPAPRSAFGMKTASLFAVMPPGGKGLILHSAQGRELGPTQSAVLEFVQDALALLVGVFHPAPDIGLDQDGFRGACGGNQLGRSCHTSPYYDLYDLTEQWCLA
jgi:hypothetical protein